MRSLSLGIDSGTQSTKALLLDMDKGRILGAGSHGHELLGGLPPGAKEQDPGDWFAACAAAVRQALEAAGARPGEVRCLGVSGQQHGFVPLDARGTVIRPAKLWCDTSTGKECREITEAVGGARQAVKLVGNAILPGFTAPKILWLRKHEPENYRRLATVLLPHDYLNFRLTGRRAMECGDASGTALLDVRRRTWCPELAAAIDPRLEKRLPPLMPSDEPMGRLLPGAAGTLGLTPEVLVSAGGGDNMMGAIGTGNTREGVLTASLGTSGTLYACSERPRIDARGEIAGFCDSTNRWLPLLCTMNVTTSTELVRQLHGWSHERFEKAARSVPPGSDGLLLLPYLEGERTPSIPDGTGVWIGVNQSTATPGHYARAAMEGVTLGMNYGLDRLRKMGIAPTQIRATGGGTNSKLWLQILADILDAEVVTLKTAEGAAFGAALQAIWCLRRHQGEDLPISDLTDSLVRLHPSRRALPDPGSVERYRRIQELQNQASGSLRRTFALHRSLVRQGSPAIAG